MFSNWKENSLDVLIQKAQYKNLFCVNSKDESLTGCHFPYNKNAVVIGRFAMQCHSHDTGNGVRIYILTDEMPYMIVNATYWKVGGYSHNPDTWEKGAWDNALREAIDKLRWAVENQEQQEYEQEQAALENRKLQAAKTKTKVEALFK